MAKQRIIIKVGDKSYRGRLVKLSAERIESDYKFEKKYGSTDEEFIKSFGLKSTNVISRFGNGEYKFVSSYCDFKICWVEFMDNTYSTSLSQFNHNLDILNHNRLQLHQRKILDQAIEVLRAQGLKPIANKIITVFYTDDHVQHIRDIKNGIS